MKDIFQHYYETNFWRDKESVSGNGSNLESTAAIREALPRLFESMGINSLLDISCGDFWWMSHIKEIQWLRYIGGDIVTELIHQNRERYMHPNLEFQVLDATKSHLPEVDIIFCRDTLVHFDNHSINLALKNFRASGSKWLLATTFPGANPNSEISIGQWHAIDLAALRFGLGPQMGLINEGHKGEFSNKSLGLWRLN